MSDGYQNKVFQAALEIALRATLPQGGTISNVVDRLAGSRRSVAPGVYKNEDWARDFLSCLPEATEAAQLVMLCYVPAFMCKCNVINLDEARCEVCGEWPQLYRMLPHDSRRAGGLTRSFWLRVQQRRLFSQGLSIAEGYK